MTKSPLDIVFFATPQFAVPILEKLASDNRFKIRAVVTQPDAPSGRGQKLTPPPIKIAAESLSLPCAQPESLKYLSPLLAQAAATDDLLANSLVNPGLDFIVVVAYGKIIPNFLLNLLPSGVINVHPSLLPRWRGAAPIQRSLFAGDTITGTSIMKLDQGIDTGPVFCQERLEIKKDDNCASLHNKLAAQGAELLTQSLLKISTGELKAVAQPEIGATYAEKWDKQDLIINWQESAETTINRIRASTPAPGARTFYQGSLVKILDGEAVDFPTGSTTAPATILSATDCLIIKSGSDQSVAIKSVQLPGKKVTTVKALANSGLFKVGEKLSDSE